MMPLPIRRNLRMGFSFMKEKPMCNRLSAHGAYFENSVYSHLILL